MQSTVLAFLINILEPIDWPQIVAPRCLLIALLRTCNSPKIDSSKFQVRVHPKRLSLLCSAA